MAARRKPQPALLEPDDTGPLLQAGSELDDPLKAIFGLVETMIAQANGDAYVLNAVLSEGFAPLGPSAASAIQSMILGRTGPVIRHLAAYWCLDEEPGLRAEAAKAFRRWEGEGLLTGADAARLAFLRQWVPCEDAAMLADPSAAGGALQTEGAATLVVEQAFASLPDGAGAQTMVVAGRRDDQPVSLCILIKEAEGIADAYEVVFDGASEQTEALQWTDDQLELFPVPMDTVLDLMGRALNDGLSANTLPAPGLLDVLLALGLTDFVPRPASAAERLAHLDAKGALAGLSKQKIGRLITSSESWPQMYQMVCHWGEAPEEIKPEGASQSAGLCEANVWRYLEERRERWARLAAQGACVLKGALEGAEIGGPRAWQEMAAVSQALLDGRPLKKIPIMEWVVDGTLEMAEVAADQPADLTAFFGTKAMGSA